MGRHKDPAILLLFEELNIIGESYGFKVTDEFTVLGGLYYIDMVWTPYEDHNVVITFEVEKEDERTLDNINKIIGTSTEVSFPENISLGNCVEDFMFITI